MKKMIINLLNRLRINASEIFKIACTWTGVFMTIWGFLSLFVSMSGMIPDGLSFIIKILMGCLILLGVFIILIIISGFYVLSVNNVRAITSNSGHHVYVKYGDIFSPKIIKKGNYDCRNIVIPVNRCFDTIVDKHLVSRNTLHGKLLQSLYCDNKYTSDSLNDKIQQSLVNSPFHMLPTSDKSSGNLKRYDVGTIAELELDSQMSYYLLGLSTFDKKLNAHTSKKDFVLSVQKLIDFCDQRAQGNPVILPLLGSGMSRTNIELKDSLNYLIKALAINKDKINCDFYIVIWKGDKDRVSIKDL